MAPTHRARCLQIGRLTGQATNRQTYVTITGEWIEHGVGAELSCQRTTILQWIDRDDPIGARFLR